MRKDGIQERKKEGRIKGKERISEIKGRKGGREG